MFSARSVTSPATALPLVALVALAAIAATLTVSCKDKPAENAVDAAPSTVQDASTVLPMASTPMPSASAAAEGDHDKRGGAHGGPASMLFQAARALELKDDQKAKIDAAEKAAHAGGDDASREAMKNAGKDLHTDLIAGIKAGKIDTAKLEPRYAAVEKVATETHAKETEALTALHAALDATQRKAVTANVRAKQAAREAKMGAAMAGAGADAGASDAGGADGGKGFAPGKRTIDRLTRGLDLDAEQQKKVDAIAAKEDGSKAGHPDSAEMKRHVEALLAAFEKDTFDAKKLGAEDAKMARGPMEHETKLLAQLVPILKPEQREKLAAKMEKGPSPHNRRPGFGHRPMGQDDD
jgi:Spy/CpxP family protein refolding chaperone